LGRRFQRYEHGQQHGCCYVPISLHLKNPF
jgi:hypothetical protein